MYGSASFSKDGQYRYDLVRRWDPDNPRFYLWVLLNPSTADADTNDNTITRCIGFSKRDGMGGMVVVNLYAWRSTVPEALRHVFDPIGPWNNATILWWAEHPQCVKVIAAWSGHAGIQGDKVFSLIKWNAGHEMWCFGLTKKGYPLHPLYQPKDAQFQRLQQPRPGVS